MKNLLLVLLFAIQASGGFTQNVGPYTYYTDPVTGMVQFNSNLPSSNLHFYVFGDGYFFSGMHPSHFHNPGVHETILFTVGNKEGDDPTKEENDIVVPPHNGTPPNPFQPINIATTIEAQLGWNITSDFDGMIVLKFQNDFSSQLSSGCIEFQYNPAALDVSEWDISTPSDWCQLTSAHPGLFKWEYTKLAPDEQRVIYLNAKSNVAAGSNLNALATLAPNCANPIISLLSFTSSTYPHDPNKKIVTNTDELQVTRGLPRKEVPQTLVYEVEFHNNGNNFAEDVYVYDQIHPYADPSTLEFLGSTHPSTYHIQGNMLYVVFDNIMLPGSNQVTPQTYSFAETLAGYSYSICVPEEIEPLDCMPTNVEIVFDQLQSVFADHDICAQIRDTGNSNPCRSGGSSQTDDRSGNATTKESTSPIYPNPSYDFIRVPNIDRSSIRIIRSETGEIIPCGTQYFGNDLEVDIRHLNSGFYILEISSELTTRYERFIKID